MQIVPTTRLCKKSRCLTNNVAQSDIIWKPEFLAGCDQFPIAGMEFLLVRYFSVAQICAYEKNALIKPTYAVKGAILSAKVRDTQKPAPPVANQK